MIVRLARALLWAAAVYVVCILVAMILGVTNVVILEVIGAWLGRFAVFLGVLAGVYHFLGGKMPPW